MKLHREELSYCIELDSLIHICIQNDSMEFILRCFQEYFGKKKKSFCKVFDSFGNQILPSEFDFLYIPYQNGIDKEMELKEKSNLNSYFCSFIEHNQEYFQSIDTLRNAMHELLSDQGFFKLYKILKQGIFSSFTIDVETFDLQKILQMFHIICDTLSEEEQFLILYNMELFLHKEHNCIVYIDFPISEKTIQWIQSIERKNVVFFLGGELTMEAVQSIDSCVFHKFSKQDFVETIEYNIKELPCIYYCFQPFVKQFFQFQNEEIQRYYQEFQDENCTFSLIFANENVE